MRQQALLKQEQEEVQEFYKKLYGQTPNPATDAMQNEENYSQEQTPPSKSNSETSIKSRLACFISLSDPLTIYIQLAQSAARESKFWDPHTSCQFGGEIMTCSILPQRLSEIFIQISTKNQLTAGCSIPRLL